MKTEKVRERILTILEKRDKKLCEFKSFDDEFRKGFLLAEDLVKEEFKTISCECKLVNAMLDESQPSTPQRAEEVKDRCKYELIIENYFGLTTSVKENDKMKGVDYGTLVDLICYADQQLTAPAFNEIPTAEEDLLQEIEDSAFYTEEETHVVYYDTVKKVLEAMESYRTQPKEDVKPPLGLMPEWRHNELRVEEINGAIERYNEANYSIPGEWINEKNDLQYWLKNHLPTSPLLEAIDENDIWNLLKWLKSNHYLALTESRLQIITEQYLQTLKQQP